MKSIIIGFLRVLTKGYANARANVNHSDAKVRRIALTNMARPLLSEFSVPPRKTFHMFLVARTYHTTGSWLYLHHTLTMIELFPRPSGCSNGGIERFEMSSNHCSLVGGRIFQRFLQYTDNSPSLLHCRQSGSSVGHPSEWKRRWSLHFVSPLCSDLQEPKRESLLRERCKISHMSLVVCTDSSLFHLRMA